MDFASKMKVGINYAWKNYAWDFGLPPQKDSGNNWGARAAWKATIDRELAELVEVGFFCVRWFLLGDGTTYGTGDKRPQQSENRWRFDDPPPLSPEFLEDFEFLLTRCKAAGILLLPSLVDFHFCFPGVVVAGSSQIVKCGRYDAIIDPQKRALFLSHTLEPLLKVAAAHRDSIYAVEVMNEPEWCTKQPWSPSDAMNPNKTVPLGEMRAFLRQGARMINGAGFVSTVGFAMHPSLQDWDSPDLEVTLHQFHFYTEPPQLPRHDFDPRWPAIVGEFATAPHRPWPALGASQDVLSRLRHIEEQGYPVAFPWSANREEEHSANPPAVDFSDANRALMRRYIRGG